MTDRPVPEVLCLGETMILLTPSTATSLEIATSVQIHAGGAESNLAMNLAAAGVGVGWASRVGDDPFGRRIVSAVARHGVDTRWVEVDPTRPTAVYFKDPGVAGSTVYYYRRGSAAAGLTPAFLDRLPLAELRLLHLSGITPGLSTDCRETVAGALARMRPLPGLVCFDVNYRAGVWGADEAGPVITELARQADVVLVGRDEAETLWGPDCATAEQIRAHLPDVPHLVVKDGAVGATEFCTNGRGAADRVFVPTPPVQVVEPVGAGDAFGAGYLSGLLDGLDAGQRLLRGHRLAAVALSSTADVADAAAIAAAAGRTPDRHRDQEVR